MAVNPMQKKARNAFMLGMIIAIIVCLILGVLAYFLLVAPQTKKEKDKGEKVKVQVLNQNVTSGQVITEDMLSEIEVYASMVPANYISSVGEFFLMDDEGNSIYTKVIEKDGKKETKMYVTDVENTEYKTLGNSGDDKDRVLVQKAKNGRLYKTKKTGEEEYFAEEIVPTVAKVALSKNTILTQGMVTPSDQIMTDDLRYVEYNMLTLSTTVDEGSVIDIRLTLPNGLDLVVVSKKEIQSMTGNTIGLNLTEDEILMMESAIVEAYIMKSSKLYATEYIEPGLQGALKNTYVPTDEVQKLILGSGNNIQATAKEALANRFITETRDNINNDKNKYYDVQLSNIEEGIQQEIENAKAAREAYLNGLTSY